MTCTRASGRWAPPAPTIAVSGCKALPVSKGQRLAATLRESTCVTSQQVPYRRLDMRLHALQSLGLVDGRHEVDGGWRLG